MAIYRDLVLLIIAFTCVGVFVATAIATVLDLFNLLKLARDVRRKLHVVLLIEIVGIAVAAFRGFLDPAALAYKVEGQKIQLEKQITDSTKVVLQAATKDSARDVVSDFPWVDTASAPGYTVAASPYLHALGISVAGVTPESSEVVLVNNRAVYGGQAAKPTLSQNFLTQIGPIQGPASFTLNFSEPFASVRFVRPALYAATPSGITHPAWSAHALDAAGREVASQGETLIQAFSDVPARAYALDAPRGESISSIRFDSDFRKDGKPFAAFAALLIEQLTMTRRDQ